MTYYGHGHAPRSGRSRSRKPAKKKRQLPSTFVIGGLVVVALLILWGALVGWRVLGAKSDLDQATAQADDLQQALSDRDVNQAKTDLDALQNSLEASDGKLDDLAVKAAAKVPFLGRNISSVRTVNTALLEIASDGLPPVVDKAADLGSNAFKPKNGTINVSVVASLAKPLERADSVIGPANQKVQDLSTSGLVGPVAKAVDQAKEKLADASSLSHKGAVAARVVPALLGSQSTQRYLLVFTNNAAIRSEGGFVGAWAELVARNGNLTIGRQGTGHVGDDLPRNSVKLSEGERTLLGSDVGYDLHEMTRLPDFPRAAKAGGTIISAAEQIKANGVIMLDPVTLSYMLKATGGVTLADGTRLTSDNAVDELLNRVYLRLPTQVQQDAFFADAAQRIFSSIAGGRGDTSKLLSELQRAVTEGRLKLWARSNSVEKLITGSRLAGDTGEATDRIGVYLNSTQTSKMDYYLRYSVSGQARCSANTSQTAIEARLSSVAPADAGSLPDVITGADSRARIGLDVLVLAPKGGQVSAVTVDGKKVKTRTGTLGGRSGTVATVTLLPGQKGVLKATVTSGQGQSGTTTLDVTPSVQPGDKSSVVRSSCS